MQIVLEPATNLGLIVIGRTSTILLDGLAAALLLPKLVGANVLSADLDGPGSAALLRLRPVILEKSDAPVRWAVVDLRT
ncbi:MAG: hypothetical protein ACT4OK_22620 [Gemmobacter sp.]